MLWYKHDKTDEEVKRYEELFNKVNLEITTEWDLFKKYFHACNICEDFSCMIEACKLRKYIRTSFMKHFALRELELLFEKEGYLKEE